MPEESWEDFKPTITIYQPCQGEWINEQSVTIDNIEEDIFGQDVVTYECPVCGIPHKSIRRG